jgi:hypothetical protein
MLHPMWAWLDVNARRDGPASGRSGGNAIELTPL